MSEMRLRPKHKDKIARAIESVYNILLIAIISILTPNVITHAHT